MGEIIRRSRPGANVPWTGERLALGAGLQVEAEHLHRYLFARSLCRGLSVMDVASGEGYGSALLAQGARSVVGVEVDPDVAAAAARTHPAPNLSFICGDARSLPLADNSVDLIASFETIEHFFEHEAMLAEFRRVLRRGGRLVISSPERDVYSPTGQPPNPFHVRELTRAELLELLRTQFPSIQLYGQRVVSGSLLVPERGDESPFLTYDQRGEDWVEVSEGLPSPTYLVAVTSDEPAPASSGSVYVISSQLERPSIPSSDEHRRLGEYAQQLENAVADKDTMLSSAAAYARTLEEKVIILQEETAAGHAVQAELTQAVADKQAALHREAETRQAGRDTVRAKEEEQRALSRELALARGALDVRDRLNTELELSVRRLQALRQSQAEEIDALHAAAAVTARGTAELQRANQSIQSQALELSQRVRQLERTLAEKSLLLAMVPESTSWKVSRPLRSFARLAPRTTRVLKRALLRRGGLPASVPSTEYPGLWTHVMPSGEAQAPTHLDGPEAGETRRKAHMRQAVAEEFERFIAVGQALVLPCPEAPQISVVVPVWNQAPLLLQCLRALLMQHDACFEVIIVDNASDLDTKKFLRGLHGVALIENAINEGYVRACNAGAAAARGQFILHLNSDACPRSGAIAAAMDTLRRDASLGAVGGRLVLPSGRLQEAGSIVWADGSTLGYGRGWNPDRGEAMFRRCVDYCSGAFLLTRAELWRRLGGFDNVFAPAYYEETDYCMRLREHGFHVVYEPAAVVDHFEFGSEKRAGDAVRSSLVNRNKFVARHLEALRAAHLPACPENILSARMREQPMRQHLLIVDNEVPLATLGSGFPRMRALLNAAVSEGWSVTFFPMHQLEIDWDSAYKELPREVEIISDVAVPGLREFLLTRAGYYQAVIVSRPDNMKLFMAAAESSDGALATALKIYDAEAIFSLREIERRRLLGKPMSRAQKDALIASEVDIARDCDIVLCANEAEAAIYRARQHKPVQVLSHPVLVRSETPTFGRRKGFLFVGRLLEREAPNWQGLAWFVRQCWPLIRASIPEAVISIVGHHHADTEELQAEGIHLLGAQEDLIPWYDGARVFVSPVQFAAGIPLKLIEASANGLPSVATLLMARQLSWTVNVEMCGEDGTAAFATAAVRLHEDQGLWEATRLAAAARVARDYSPERFADALRAVVNQAVSNRPSKTHSPDGEQNIP